MTTAEKCEKVLRLIVDAALKGHTITVKVTDEEEFNSDRWLAVEALHYLCLLAPPLSNFEVVVEELSKGL